MASSAVAKKILVVEDDPMVSELLLTRLDLAGYRTALARDGVHAMAALRADTPDAVILDLNMPRADGFEVLRYLNNRPGSRQPRVMVVSARRSADDVRRCMSLGATDFISKPFDDRVFLKRIARLTRDHVERVSRHGDLLL
jgi:DNA-binding response OmpR family regulator